MNLTKTQWTIIGVVVAIILVWYFWRRNKQYKNCLETMRRTPPITEDGVKKEFKCKFSLFGGNPHGAYESSYDGPVKPIPAPPSMSDPKSQQQCYDKCIAAGGDKSKCHSLCYGVSSISPGINCKTFISCFDKYKSMMMSPKMAPYAEMNFYACVKCTQG